MTASTVSAASRPKRRVRSGARLVDLAWLTWRQHRLLITATVLGLAATIGYLLWVRAGFVGLECSPTCSVDDPLGFTSRVNGPMNWLLMATSALGGIIAVFWGAPLLAREYEQRTHLLVWTQDVSPMRWLVSKVALLSGLAVLFSVALALAGGMLVGQMNSADPGAVSLFENPAFELWLPLLPTYALFGLALGVAIGGFTRSTVTSMGLTLLGFTATRVLVGSLGRPNFEAPLRYVGPLGAAPRRGDPNALMIDMGYLDTAGNKVSIPADCLRSDNITDCMTSRGIVGFEDYQPGDRLDTFRLIELGIFLGLAVVLFALAWWRLRKDPVL